MIAKERIENVLPYIGIGIMIFIILMIITWRMQ